MSDNPAITPSDTLATLATRHPGASRAFARHNLDFCCHGKVTLAETCNNKGLDVDALIQEITDELQQPDSETRWDTRPLPDLIAHLRQNYHEPHREELPRLHAMASKVEKVHGDKESCPRGLADLLGAMCEELEQHMQKEEQILFPMIADGKGAFAGNPIRVMEQEHVDAGAQLAKIRNLTTDHVPPVEACNTWRALYLGLAEFERELMKHVHLENYVLFPRALGN